MKLLSVLFLFVLLGSACAAPAAQRNEKQSLVVEGKQHRWVAADLKAHHEQMRKTHKNYIPYYPDAPILTYITVGTPPTIYWVSLESGSEAIFLLANDYPGRNLTNNQPYFDPSQSSTARKAGDYFGFAGELEASGTAYDDVVGLFGGLGQFWNTTQRFGVVNDVVAPYVVEPAMPDGVLGMSWDPEDAANPNENSSAIINFFKATGFERYWCQFLADATDPQAGREYQVFTTFGSCLDLYCKPPTADNTVPLTWLEDSRSLAFQVDAFTYDGQQFKGGYGKVDTGVPHILLPYDAFLAVYTEVQPDFDFTHYIYTLDCSQAGRLPDWTFTIGGRNYTIPSTAYVVDLLLPDGKCAWSMQLSDTWTTDYVLGYVFHDLWCIKMDIDNQAISFLDFTPDTTAAPATD